MGQQNSYQAGSNNSLTLVQQLPIGKVFKDAENDALYFIKEYAYTSQEAFQQAFLKFSAKLTSKNENILNLQKTNTKVDNTFCSTFYKIILIFDFVNYSLADEIAVRNKESRIFEEKQIWSILFHCTLGISHLKRTEGIQHSAIGLKDIKLSLDGTIKILPLQMVGISNEHDQNEGTTKKLAMVILSCILMKHISNQSSEYLQALIDKTKCSKQLKKVLYIMIMEDSTFKELQEYLYKLANDENDTILSGVSTPLNSSHKKTTIQESNVKKMSQGYLANLRSKGPLNPMLIEKEELEHEVLMFETFEVENPDENDEEKSNENLAQEQQQTIANQCYETQTFASEGNINIDYKLKDHSNTSISLNQDDATVRMMSKKQSNASEFANIQKVQIPPTIKSQGLYTDPKLLDLIKKDLQQIQHKGRISFGGNKSQTSETKFKIETQPQINPLRVENENSSFKRSNIYNISACDFNIKPVSNENLNAITSQQNEKKTKSQIFEGSIKLLESQKKVDKLSNKSDDSFKQIQNIPLRTRQQQCYGNILDQDASFKKEKPKKSTTTTARQPEFKREQDKENISESTQTKRAVQTYQQKTNNQTFSNNKQKVAQSKSTIQLITQTSISQPQSETSLMQFVNETYQKGEYKGYKMNGLRHGQGTFYYKEGGKYIGEWRQNKMNGKGILYYPNDQVAYDGNWKDDQLHGYGTLYNQEVTLLEKSFDYQDWAMVEQYWVKYEGEFSMDNKQGRGKLYLSNGQIFEGWFKEDMIEGQGVLTRQNGSRVRGIWRKNKLLRMY